MAPPVAYANIKSVLLTMSWKVKLLHPGDRRFHDPIHYCPAPIAIIVIVLPP
jgi:hypothetical protein